MSRLLTTLAVLLVGLGPLSASPAAAHANLVRVEPADGATVTVAPEQVRLVFDEDMRPPATIVVTDPSGDRVEQGAAQVLDNTAVVDVTVARAGDYTVAFRVVSADGHPVAQQTTFRYAPGGTAQAGDPAPTSQASPRDHAGHEAGGGDGFSTTRVVGIAAGSALLVGLALLTVRRLPGGLVDPRKEQP